MGRDESGAWLRYAGIGCLGAVGVSALIVGALVGVAWLELRSEQLADDSLAPDPSTVGPAVPAGGAPSATAVGVVELVVAQADFTIERAATGESIQIDAAYDRTGYELTESLGEPDDGPWVYRIEFRRTRSGVIETVRQLLGGSRPRITLYVPGDRPLELRTLVRSGAVDARLGGLWLTSATVDVERGGAFVRFDEPTPNRLERFRLRGTMGGVNVEGLALASPKQVEVAFTMGGFNLDLRGPWRGDSSISISTSMGGGNVFLPDEVELRGVEGRGPRAVGADDELARPTLSFTVDGEVEFN